jgi:pSer/pThr/pTyr-binding forkhead associated (FHA) protein
MPFAIQLMDGQRSGEILPLISNSVTIGRSAGEILLEDTEVSGRHCTVQMNSGELIIIDHSSRNGTFLNGRRVDRNRLRAGDTLQIGQSVFRIVEWPETPNFVDPVAIAQEWCRQISESPEMQAHKEIAALVEKEIELCISDVQIRLTLESKDGRIISHLVPSAEVILGRAGSVPLLAEDEEASRKHARLFVDSEGYIVVEDLGSANGTYFNEERLAGRRRIFSGDKIRLGRTIVKANLSITEFSSAIQF